MSVHKLNVQAIFDSIDGEANAFDGAGQLTTFIRLKDCNLSCGYCLAGGALLKVIDNNKIKTQRIKDVVVGQSVVSFDLKEGKLVTSKITKKIIHEVDRSEMIRIEMNNGSNYQILYVTKEHPFYTEGEWVEAWKLKIGDVLYSIPTSTINKHSALFRDNVALYKKVSETTTGKCVSEETMQKMSISAKKREAGMTKEQKKQRAIKGHITRSKWGRITGCEKYFIALLEDLPVTFVGNGKKWIGGKCPDFIVLGQKKVIEVTDSSAPFRDFSKYKKERTEHFEKHGYKSLIITIPPHANRKEIKEKTKNEIIKFIFNGKTITNISEVSSRQTARIGLRKDEGRKYTSKIPVYNIECEPHHNFVVNGVLSHNCDTKYSQSSTPENWMTIDEVISQVCCNKITITGGEPLLQQEAVDELCMLLSDTCLISVETNGTIEPKYRRNTVRYIVDYKLPSSGVEDRMLSAAFSSLTQYDMIKFVIADEEEYVYAKAVLKKFPYWIAKTVFSPTMLFKQIFPYRYSGIHELVPDMEWPRKLAELMIKDKVYAQYSLQLHKLLWPGATEEK